MKHFKYPLFWFVAPALLTLSVFGLLFANTGCQLLKNDTVASEEAPTVPEVIGTEWVNQSALASGNRVTIRRFYFSQSSINYRFYEYFDDTQYCILDVAVPIRSITKDASLSEYDFIVNKECGFTCDSRGYPFPTYDSDYICGFLKDTLFIDFKIVSSVEDFSPRTPGQVDPEGLIPGYAAKRQAAKIGSTLYFKVETPTIAGIHPKVMKPTIPEEFIFTDWTELSVEGDHLIIERPLYIYEFNTRTTKFNGDTESVFDFVKVSQNGSLLPSIISSDEEIYESFPSFKDKSLVVEEHGFEQMHSMQQLVGKRAIARIGTSGKLYAKSFAKKIGMFILI